MSQTTTTVRKLFDGRLRLERRNNSPMFYARTYLQGKSLVFRTGETSITSATDVATDWYLGLLERTRKGEQIHGRLFVELAEKFVFHAEQVKEVSAGQLEQYRVKLNLLKPYFVGVKIADIDAKFLLELRHQRSQAKTQLGTLVKPTTIKKGAGRGQARSPLRQGMGEVPGRPAAVPVFPWNGLGSGPVAASIPQPRPMDQSP